MSITYEIDWEDDVHEVNFTVTVGGVEMTFILPRPRTPDENARWVRTWNSLLNNKPRWEIEDSDFLFDRMNDEVEVRTRGEPYPYSYFSIEHIPFDSLKPMFERFANFHLCTEELGQDCEHEGCV